MGRDKGSMNKSWNLERMATMAGGVVSSKMGEEDEGGVRSGTRVMWNKADRN